MQKIQGRFGLNDQVFVDCVQIRGEFVARLGLISTSSTRAVFRIFGAPIKASAANALLHPIPLLQTGALHKIGSCHNFSKPSGTMKKGKV